MRKKIIIVVLLFSFTTFHSSLTSENNKLWLSINQREFDNGEIFKMYFHGEKTPRELLVIKLLGEAKKRKYFNFFLA